MLLAAPILGGLRPLEDKARAFETAGWNDVLDTRIVPQRERRLLSGVEGNGRYQDPREVATFLNW